MKNKILFIIAVISLAACSKSFLEKPPLSTLSAGTFYQNEQQLLEGTAALYNKVWYTYNFKAVMMMELRAGGILSIGSSGQNPSGYKNFAVPSTDPILADGWASFYNTIGQANTIIQGIELYASPSVPEAAKKNAIAEARFMRGVAYSYLVSLWKDVPVIENNSTLLTDTTKRRNTFESVWDFIIKDLTYAADNLYETAPQPGRLTKYAGKAMLARMYLAKAGVGMSSGQRRQADLDKAAELCRDVIAKGPYRLMDDYEELFKMKNNNNSESIFAFQSFYLKANNWGSLTPCRPITRSAAPSQA